MDKPLAGIIFSYDIAVRDERRSRPVAGATVLLVGCIALMILALASGAPAAIAGPQQADQQVEPLFP